MSIAINDAFTAAQASLGSAATGVIALTAVVTGIGLIVMLLRR